MAPPGVPPSGGAENGQQEAAPQSLEGGQVPPHTPAYPQGYYYGVAFFISFLISFKQYTCCQFQFNFNLFFNLGVKNEIHLKCVFISVRQSLCPDTTAVPVTTRKCCVCGGIHWHN